MYKIKKQMGIATLEIILALAIIGILAGAVVPQMARVLDKVALNYEMKRLYSELNFARSLGRIAWYKASVFPDVKDSNHEIRININRTEGYYEFYRYISSTDYSTIDKHYLPRKFKIDYKYVDPLLSFDSDGNALNSAKKSAASGHYILTSKFKKNAYIIFDSVGRWRGDYKEPR